MKNWGIMKKWQWFEIKEENERRKDLGHCWNSAFTKIIFMHHDKGADSWVDLSPTASANVLTLLNKIHGTEFWWHWLGQKHLRVCSLFISHCTQWLSWHYEGLMRAINGLWGACNTWCYTVPGSWLDMSTFGPQSLWTNTELWNLQRQSSQSVFRTRRDLQCAAELVSALSQTIESPGK